MSKLPGNKKPRGKMPISERAKQFAPFAAVGGLDAALARKEKEHARKARAELLDDAAEHLNEKLSQLYIGDCVEITYYYRGEYLKVHGTVEIIDRHRRLLVVDSTEIHFKDLYAIR